ncbi:MAG: hypothetical protein PHI59_09470 [Candidatus Omnitrophica bacterium]|nr:hypothetical protein [Candidatus Omnitrophota bacterium]
MIRRPVNIMALTDSVIGVLTFLTSAEGRTDANCWTVDLFLTIDDDWEEEWPEMPDALYDIIFDMGAQLHDTFKSPEVARNFESLPEQLLDRAKKIERK